MRGHNQRRAFYYCPESATSLGDDKQTMLEKALQALDWFSRQYQKVLKPILVALYSVMSVIVVYAVFMRYVMRDSPDWSEELTRYIMVWSAFLAMGIALRDHRHIGLTTIVERLWGRFTKYAYLVADLAILFFFGLVLYTGIDMTLFVARQNTPSMNWPMWIPYLSVPAGAFFLVIETLILILKKLTGKDRTHLETQNS